MNPRLVQWYLAMSRPTELTAQFAPSARVDWHRERDELAERCFKRCEHCERILPLHVSRCRNRRCPGYAKIWARDAMRKIRENLREYDGLVAMISVTAPGQEAGLVWDRTVCTHAPTERCSGPKGCRVESTVAHVWNEFARGWWRELNRICKQRADRRVRALGFAAKGGVLMYEWELQSRGVWHLHLIVGMDTAVERAWAFEYVTALSLLSASKGFGYVDRKPLRSPQEAERCAGYLSKYLAKWNDGELEISETVKSAGRSLLTYVSVRLTQRSGVTMRALRNARLVWAWREGHLDRAHGLLAVDFFVALCLLDSSATSRAP